MWNTTNGLGKQVVWYSEEEYQAIKKLNEANKGLLTATAKQNYQLLQEYDKLKTENDELKKNYFTVIQQRNKAEKTLTEIKPILEYYANSTIGEEQEDGTYRIELSYKYGSSNMYGAPCYYKYNPKPARQALQKINEVEND